MGEFDTTQIVTIIFAFYGVAQAIARATPTPKDDEIVSKVGKFLNVLFSKSKTK